MINNKGLIIYIMNNLVFWIQIFCYRCGPCQRIAPTFVKYSTKYPQAVFLKIDVDQCKVKLCVG